MQKYYNLFIMSFFCRESAQVYAFFIILQYVLDYSAKILFILKPYSVM